MDNFTLVDKTVIFCARRGSGKSELMKYLIKIQRDLFKTIFLLSPTEEINGDYLGIVKRENVFSDYNEEWMNKLISSLTKINANKPSNEKQRICLILDDIGSDTRLHNAPSFKKIFARGRHLGISLLISIQYLYQIPPLCRSNSDFICVGQLNKQSIDLLADEFICGDIEKSDFIKMYHRCTTDYRFLIINQTSIKDNSNLDLIYGRIKVPDIK